MKVAHLVSCSTRYPLLKHNGRYDWVLRLARMQAAAGIEVVIYSNVGSFVDIAGVEWRSIPELHGNTKQANTSLLLRALLDSDIDIYHSHFDSLHYEVADKTTKPIVYTQHWFPNKEVAAAAHSAKSSNVYAVPVTQYMAAEDAALGIPAVPPIYHGIDLGLFHPSATTRTNRLLFVGRIAPHKNVAEAVDIARAASAKLDIIGKINTKDRAYWNSFSNKVDGDTIRYVGPRTLAEVADAMQRAKALLFPIRYHEAFGQAIIEAQACGTPVILGDVGSSSELVIHGETGFLANDTADYLTAIAAVGSIDAQACRKNAERFSDTATAQAYTNLYMHLVG